MDEELLAVNRRGGISDKIFDNLLCVEIENNPSRGNYYGEGETDLTDRYLQTLRNKLEYSFKPEWTPLPSRGGDTSYMVGDRIGMAYVSSDDSLYQAGAGFFVMPVDFMSSPSCTTQNFAKYGEPSQTSCVLKVPNLLEACEDGSILTAERFFNARRVAKRSTSSISDLGAWTDIKIVAYRYKQNELEEPVTVPDIVPIPTNISNVLDPSDPSYDPNATVAPSMPPTDATDQPTGEPTLLAPTLEPTTEPTSEPTFIIIGNTSAPTLFVRPEWKVLELPPIYFNRSSCTCENAVVGVEMVFHHELSGLIEDVTLQVVLDSIEGELCFGGS
jgi:hypothetical protein